MIYSAWYCGLLSFVSVGFYL